MLFQTLVFSVFVSLASSAIVQDRQDTLEKVKALYAAAAYDDALAALPEAGDPKATPSIEEFRALCLLALGREDDAEAALARALEADPRYAPSTADAPPRLVSAFERTRLRLLPQLVTSNYAGAKRAFEAKDYEAAIKGFERVMALADLAPEEAAGVDDVALLASEFLDLSRARHAELKAEAEPPPTNGSGATTNGNGAGPSSPPVSAPLKLAVPIRQDMPPWAPPDGIARSTSYDGLLRVSIGADGKVAGAEIVRPTHPAYDAMLLRASRRWTYQPALRGTLAVASQLDIEIRLRPRPEQP
jgi:TonB family protein